MIHTLDIMETVKALAKQALPELAQVYMDHRPKHFKRPALLIEAVTTGTEDAAAGLVQVSEYFTLTLYDRTDNYDRTVTRDILALRHKLLNLFRGGTIQVADRHLHIQASTGGRDWDKGYIDLQLTYYDDRDDAPDTTPPMETIHTEVKYRKG